MHSSYFVVRPSKININNAKPAMQDEMVAILLQASMCVNTSISHVLFLRLFQALLMLTLNMIMMDDDNNNDIVMESPMEDFPS